MSRSPIPIDDRLEAVPADDGSGALLRERGGGRSVVFLSSAHLRQLSGQDSRPAPMPAVPPAAPPGDQEHEPTEAQPSGTEPTTTNPAEPAAPAQPTKPARTTKAGTKGARS